MKRSDLGNTTKERRERLIRATMLGDGSCLDGLEEHALFLEEILTGPYSVVEIDGELKLLQIKALVARIRGLKIEIYPNEHPPPHFHVRSATIDASFAIEDCSLLNGSIPRREYDLIKVWHRTSKKMLIDKWNEMRPTDCSVGNYKRTKLKGTEL